jgi:hypothetical protein
VSIITFFPGVVDTGQKYQKAKNLFSGVNDTADNFFGGVSDTGD